MPRKYDDPPAGYKRWTIFIKIEHCEYIKEESRKYDMTIKDLIGEIIQNDIDKGETDGKSDS